MRNRNLLFKIPGQSDITIGVVFPFFWSDSSIRLYHGIRDAAEKYRMNLLFIQGYYESQCDNQKSQEPPYEKPGNIVYKLISRYTIDGLIIFTSGLKHHSDKLDLVRHCKVFEPIPCISVGSDVENIPNIVIDRTNAVKTIMRHLIEIHSRRRIAFIHGPNDHTDSSECLEAYRSSLNDYKIEYSDLLVSSNSVWSKDRAYTATLELMTRNNNCIDAILCTNDYDANCAIVALRSLNISVPDDIAVTGFNNDFIAEAATPSITSIDQNLYGRGQLAIKILSDHINGIHLSSDYKVDAPIIIRQSCGCLARAAKAVETVFITRHDSPVKTAGVIDTSAIRDQLTERVFEALNTPRNDKTLSWCKKVVDTFVTTITDTTKKDFLHVFNQTIHQYVNWGFDITHWHDALSVLDLSLEYFTDIDYFTVNRALLVKARIHLSEAYEQIQKASLLRMEERNAAINALNHSLNTTIDLNRILDLLACDFPKIGIQSCYLALYEDPNKPLMYSKLMLAYNRTGRLTIPSGGVRFRSIQILPEEFITLSQHKSLILEPLFHGCNQIGFILFELERKDTGFYGLFPAELSAALWSSQLKSTIEKNENLSRLQSDEITRFNEALQERASELEFAFQQIERNHDRLLLAEKMASLGRLTAGIAHEINTPLATIRASIGELDLLVNELNQSIDDQDIVSDDLRQIFNDMQKAVDLSEKSVQNAVSYIKSIQEQAGNSGEPEISDFDLLAAIDSVIRFLNHSIKQSLCNVQLNVPREPVMIRGSSQKMIQVFTNLLTNAIDALEYSDTRLITISLHIENCDLTVSVADTGCGIPEESMKNIFVPLFTTKPFGRGTGLGLPIVQKIITEDFNGKISVKTESGKGTTFYLHLKTI
jgi:signal transduction histidine kinase/DNA-binding LacI/PurR family transcriptional regulator